MPLAVGRRRRVLEDDVVGHQLHHGVDVVPVEGVVEALDRGQRLGGRGVHLWLLPNKGGGVTGNHSSYHPDTVSAAINHPSPITTSEASNHLDSHTRPTSNSPLTAGNSRRRDR